MESLLASSIPNCNIRSGIININPLGEERGLDGRSMLVVELILNIPNNQRSFSNTSLSQKNNFKVKIFHVFSRQKKKKKRKRERVGEEKRVFDFPKSERERVMDKSVEAFNPFMRTNSSENLDKKFLGHYEIRSQLGEGLCGQVSEAYNLQTKQRCALKAIDLEIFQNSFRMTKIPPEILLSKLENEMKVMSVLKHPLIVQLYESFQLENTFYLAMELIEGREMIQLILETKGLPESEGQLYFKQLTQALRYCHKHSVIHGDIKPENVMVNRFGGIKLIDFGFSYFVQDTSQKIAIIGGTTSYAPPERYMSFAWDVWSLGIFLYVMFTCAFPFKRAEMWKKGEEDQNFVVRIPEQMSDDALDLLSKLLSVPPAQRYTMDQVVEHRWVHSSDSEPFEERIREKERQEQLLKERQRFEEETPSNTETMLKFADWGKEEKNFHQVQREPSSILQFTDQKKKMEFLSKRRMANSSSVFFERLQISEVVAETSLFQDIFERSQTRNSTDLSGSGGSSFDDPTEEWPKMQLSEEDKKKLSFTDIVLANAPMPTEWALDSPVPCVPPEPQRKEEEIPDSEKWKRRRVVYNQIINSEKNFVQDLRYLAQVQVRCQFGGILSKPETERLCSPVIKELYALHRDICNSLEQGGQICLMKCFTPWALKAPKLYVKYISNIPKALEALEKFSSQNIDFVEMLERQNVFLQSFILSPLTRMNELPILFSRLLENTPQSIEPYPRLVKFVKSITNANNAINSRMKKKYKRLPWLHGQAFFSDPTSEQSPSPSPSPPPPPVNPGSVSFVNNQGPLDFGFLEATYDLSELPSGTNSFTLETWVKSDFPAIYDSNYLTSPVMISRYDQGPGFYFQIHNSNAPNGKLYMALSYAGDSIVVENEDLSLNFFDNQWHHVAFVRDSSVPELRLYRDGVPIASTITWNKCGILCDITAGLGANLPLGIGNAGRAASRMQNSMFLGLLDEVRVWTVARTDAEILANYDSSINGSVAGLARCYHFDETDPSQFVDCTPSPSPRTLVRQGISRLESAQILEPANVALVQSSTDAPVF
mmetsp:Transcript_25392/g.35148  ORF Transcript_25392/g.35148 Transcript_25392/m.35148 type:complete len:1052 (-) Transcript_25392:71-3226(-)